MITVITAPNSGNSRNTFAPHENIMLALFTTEEILGLQGKSPSKVAIDYIPRSDMRPPHGIDRLGVFITSSSLGARGKERAFVGEGEYARARHNGMTGHVAPGLCTLEHQGGQTAVPIKP